LPLEVGNEPAAAGLWQPLITGVAAARWNPAGAPVQPDETHASFRMKAEWHDAGDDATHRPLSQLRLRVHKRVLLVAMATRFPYSSRKQSHNR